MSPPETLEANPETGYPDPPERKVWTQWPPDPLFLSDPEWYNTLGQDRIDEEGIFSLPVSEQINRTKALLSDHPTKALHILFKAAVKGKREIVRTCLEEGVNPVANEEEDQTLVPLHAACYNGNTESAIILHEVGGVDINLRDDIGGTPLMRAAWGGHAETVKWLLLKGADPTIRQDSDVDALEFAAGGGSLEAVQAIFEHERVRVKVEITPKAIAAGAGRGSEEILRFLLQKGEYPDSGPQSLEHPKFHASVVQDTWKGARLSPSQKQTINGALPRASSSGSLINVRLLSSYLIPSHGPHQLDETTQGTIATSIVTAARNDHPENLSHLLSTAYPTDNPTSDSPKITIPAELIAHALLSAAEHGSLLTIQLLVSKYAADVNAAPVPQNVTPLYLAAINNHASTVHHLASTHNADIHIGNGRYANGPTALWIAVQQQNIETIKVLLQLGGPFESVDEIVRREADITSTKGASIKEVWLAARRTYRAPVEITLQRDDRESAEWLRLSYEEGVPWLGNSQIRRSDEALQVEGRELKLPPSSEEK